MNFFPILVKNNLATYLKKWKETQTTKPQQKQNRQQLGNALWFLSRKYQRKSMINTEYRSIHTSFRNEETLLSIEWMKTTVPTYCSEKQK